MITSETYDSSFYAFGDRQAGISLVYSPYEQCYYYNVYCLEATLLKELFAVEFDFLDDALETLNAEFGSWTIRNFADKKTECGSCAAK